MKNLLARSWQKVQKNQRGAALLMVLLVMTFVVLMGSSVLFTSNSGYLVKLVDRAGLDTFYSTEEILDQVRAEIQQFSTSSLQDSYTKTMADYSFIAATTADAEGIESAAQDKFQQYFLEELDTLYVDSSGALSETGSSSDKIFTFESFTGTTVPDGQFAVTMDITNGSTTSSMTTVGGTYDASNLQSLLEGALPSSSSDVTITTSEPAGTDPNVGTFTLETSLTGNRLVLKSVTISFMEDGYEVNITTDIIIEMPDFVHTGESSFGYEATTLEGVPFENVASIGKYWVKTSQTTSGALLVEGDMYGGVFFIYNESTDDDYEGTSYNSENIVFSHGGGRLITSPDPINPEHSQLETGTIHAETLSGFEVYQGTSFFTRSDSEIWASDINVHEGSDAILQGYESEHPDVYTVTQNFGGVNVAGDLRVYGGVDGNVTNFVLTGDYFGFGYGNTADSSSAILIDGTDVNFAFDFIGDSDGDGIGDKYSWATETSKLDSLFLAGTSFLTPNTRVGATNTEYALGQSLSTLPDQIAYLIPAGALPNVASNPSVMTTKTDELPTSTVDTSYVLWNTDQGEKKIGDYAESNAKVITMPYANGNTVVYYFYDFGTEGSADWRDNSNAYFADYVAANPETFTNNYSMFVTMDKIAYETMDGASINTAGNIYAMDHGVVRIGPASTSYSGLTTLANTKAQQFKNASVTLNPEISIHSDYENVAADKENPYDYYIKSITKGAAEYDLYWYDAQQIYRLYSDDSARISPATLLDFWDEDGKLVGIMANDWAWRGTTDTSGRISATDVSDVCIIVTQSGINIESSSETYEGLVMSGVGVAVQSPIISDPEKVVDALTATTVVPLQPVQPGSFILYEDDKTEENEDGETVTGLDAYNIIYAEELKLRDCPGFTLSDSQYGEVLTMVVPMIAYFDHLEYQLGDYGVGTYTPGQTDIGVVTNWAPNDLVYFENWEKH